MIWRFTISTFLLLIILGVIKCDSATNFYGVFHNASSLSIYNEALVELNTSKVDKSVYLNSSYGLNQIVENVENLLENIAADNVRRNIVFTDMHSIHNEILKEIFVKNKSEKSLNSSQYINVDNSLSGKIQASLHLHNAENILKFLHKMHFPSKEITLVVDDTDLGRNALTYWIEKSPSFNVKVVHYKFFSRALQKIDFSATIKYGSNVFLLDCDGKNAFEVFSLADDVGVAGIDQSIKWILSERTMDSLSLSCSIPAGDYYAIRPQGLSLNSSYIVSKIKDCQAKEQAAETCSTTFKEPITYKLWSNDKAKTGKAWSLIKEKENSLAVDNSQTENPFLPRLRVAFSEQEPWLSVANFSQDYQGDITPCGRNGMVGVRNKNGTNETVCFYGFSIDILKAIEKKLLFVGEARFSSDGKYGTYYEATGKADGIVGDLASEKADLGIDLISDKTRNRAIDFTTPYVITSIAVAYLQKMQYKESGILRPFSLELWIGTIGTIAALVIIVWLWERISPYGQYQLNKRSLEESKAFGLDDSANYIMGTVFTGEIIDQKPNTLGSHVAIIIISFVSILIIAAYSANLITFLVVLDEEPLISGLLDQKLVGEASTMIAGIQSSTVVAGYLYTHHDTRIRKMARTRVKQFNTFDGLVNALKKREIDVIVSDYLSVKYAQYHDRDCSIKTLQLKNAQVGVALSFNKQSSWRRRFNLAAISLVNSGESDIIKNKWFKQQHCLQKNAFYSLDIARMSSIFIWLSIGILGCVTMFMIAFFIRCSKSNCRLKMGSQ